MIAHAAQLLDWRWLQHQWWFIGLLLAVGLLAGEIASGLDAREGR